MAEGGASGGPRFDVVLRGYDRRQVDEVVGQLHRQIGRMRADLDVLRRSTPPPEPPGRSPVGLPVAHGDSPDVIGTFTDRMQSILQAAEEEAGEIRARARADARAETESVRAQLADLLRQRDAMLDELTRMRGQLEGMLVAPTGRMPVTGQNQNRGAGADRDRPEGREQQGHPPRTAGPERMPVAPGNPPLGAAAPSGPSPRPRPSPRPDPARPTPAGAGPVAPTVPPSNGSAPAGSAPTGPDRVAVEAGPSSDARQPGPRGPEDRQPASNGRPPAGPDRPVGPDVGSAPEPDPVRPSPRPTPGPRRPAGPVAGSHRLPTGAQPTVAAPGSLRPRGEPEPEAGELFRPVPIPPNATGGSDEQHTTAVPHAAARPRPEPGVEPRTTAVPRTAPRPTPGQSPEQQTTAVARPPDAPPVSPTSAEATSMVPTVSADPRRNEATMKVPAVRPADRDRDAAAPEQEPSERSTSRSR